MSQQKTVCSIDMCSGCMACIDSCTKNAITINKSLKAYNAVINEDLCVNCGRCTSVCQQNKAPELRTSIEWVQGWAKDPNIRKNSASGGFATEIARSFINTDGRIVVSCKFVDGEFVFESAKTVDEILGFSGSKYIKSNPTSAYKMTKKHLQEGKEVLFIGLPCQVAAAINFVGDKLSENLYTIDLICHGSPDPSVLEIFMQQHRFSLKTMEDIRFRIKSDFNLTEKYKHIVDKDFVDCYTMAFLKGLCYTENCYACQYAQRMRVSDLTIGDSWGSELPEDEKQKGISLALCQTEKGKKLLKSAALCTMDVNYEKACCSNRQLNSPFKKPEKRDVFLSNIATGENFDIEIFKIFPVMYFKIFVKMILKKLKIYRGGK